MNHSDFFATYSQNVDQANSLYFWKLSDEIIETLILRHISLPNSDRNVVLDAGGGTGRWIIKLAPLLNCSFILYDLSTHMLQRARINLKQANLSKKVAIVNGNLSSMTKIESQSVDAVISIYNPISFVDNQKSTVDELFRILKPKGRLLLMGQNYYNALFSKIVNYEVTAEELNWMSSELEVKWAEHVPPLKVFTQESLSALLISSGFKVTNTYGVPVFAQPGMQDFDPNNKELSNISRRLKESPELYKSLFELEMKYNSHKAVVNRGMNIFVVGAKL